MRHLALPFLVLFAAVSVTACTGDGSDDSASNDDDLRKRINPTSGSAAFELKQPAWYTPAPGGFDFAMTFGGRDIKFGERLERNAGSWSLSSGVLHEPRNLRFGFQAGSIAKTVPLELGKISIYEPAGLVMRYAKPVMGNDVVVLRRGGQDVARFVYNNAVELRDRTFSWVTLDGDHELQTAAGGKQKFKLAEGEKREIVLPVATLTLSFEGIGPAFPGTAHCIRAAHYAVGAPEHRGIADAIDVSRSASELAFPAGTMASLELNLCGEVKKLPLTADASITVHRLEVDNVEVTDPTGAKKLLIGTFTVERKMPDGRFVAVISNQPTHTGVDVTDGTYRVTSTAPNSPSHVTEITFP